MSVNIAKNAITFSITAELGLWLLKIPGGFLNQTYLKFKLHASLHSTTWPLAMSTRRGQLVEWYYDSGKQSHRYITFVGMGPMPAAESYLGGTPKSFPTTCPFELQLT
jgi:hypothetical protein